MKSFEKYVLLPSIPLVTSLLYSYFYSVATLPLTMYLMMYGATFTLHMLYFEVIPAINGQLFGKNLKHRTLLNCLLYAMSSATTAYLLSTYLSLSVPILTTSALLQIAYYYASINKYFLKFILICMVSPYLITVFLTTSGMAPLALNNYIILASINWMYNFMIICQITTEIFNPSTLLFSLILWLSTSIPISYLLIWQIFQTALIGVFINMKWNFTGILALSVIFFDACFVGAMSINLAFWLLALDCIFSILDPYGVYENVFTPILIFSLTMMTSVFSLPTSLAVFVGMVSIAYSTLCACTEKTYINPTRVARIPLLDFEPVKSVDHSANTCSNNAPYNFKGFSPPTA